MIFPQLIPWAKPDYWGHEESYVTQALQSTWISGGEFVDRLEQSVASACGVTHALAVSNGTTALHLAYLALDLRPGDEVIVPGFAFMAAANVALHMGLVPVFADVDPDTWCLTAAHAEKRVTERTKAIIPVHTYGNVCDMDSLLELGRARGVSVIEDAAESFGSTHRGRWSGAMGDLGTFSFQATKVITTGEGGMVLTPRDDLASRMKLFRSHGMLRQKRFYWHEVAGHNFRLTNLQAALGCAQFERMDQIVEARARVHGAYRAVLGGAAGISLQRFRPEVREVLWAMAVKLDPRAFPQGRDAVIEQMRAENIETRPGFYAASRMDHLYDASGLPVSEDLSAHVLSLPTYPTLSDDTVAEIAAALLRLRR